MKFLFDQNISYRILQKLPTTFEGSSHVKSEKLINASDQEIWKFAKQNDYTIVTQDSDFNDLNSLYGFPPKIVWIRVGNLKTTDIVRILINYFNEIERFLTDSDYGCFEILRFRK